MATSEIYVDDYGELAVDDHFEAKAEADTAAAPIVAALDALRGLLARGHKAAHGIRPDTPEMERALIHHAKMMSMGARCLECPLFGKDRGPVHHTPVYGPLTMIAETPDPKAIETGEVMTGKSGILTMECASKGGVSRDETSLVYTISCRPEDDFAAFHAKVKVEHGIAAREAKRDGLDIPPMPLTPEEACFPRLKADMDVAVARGANTILTLGGPALKTAARYFEIPYGHTTKVAAGQVKIVNLTKTIGLSIKKDANTPVIIPTYHPAYAMRQGARIFMPVVKLHIERAARTSANGGDTGWRPPEHQLIFPTVGEIESTIALYRAEARLGQDGRHRVICDIETDGINTRRCKIRCIGFSARVPARFLPNYVAAERYDEYDWRTWPISSIVVPIRYKDTGDDWWTDRSDKKRVLAACMALLNDTNVDLTGHNFNTFDIAVLIARQLIIDDKRAYGCTLLKTKCSWSNDLPLNLGFTTGRFRVAPSWKSSADDKVTEGVDDRVLAQYCVHGDSVIRLAGGGVAYISDIVKGRLNVEVECVDANGAHATARVIDWHRNKVEGQKWLRISVEGRKGHVTATPDHSFITPMGRVQARDLSIGDSVYVNERVLSEEARQLQTGKVTAIAEWTPQDNHTAKTNANWRYCLTVEKHHTFFVSGIAVANCALDCVETMKNDEELDVEHIKFSTLPAYSTDLALAPHFRNATDLGLMIDIPRHAEMWRELADERARRFKRLQRATWEATHGETRLDHVEQVEEFFPEASFNPGSNAEISELLYSKKHGKGIVPVIATKKGQAWKEGDDPSVNAVALTRVLGERNPDKQTEAFINRLLEYRAVNKIVGTYIEGLVKPRRVKDGVCPKCKADATWALYGICPKCSAIVGDTTIEMEVVDGKRVGIIHPIYKQHIPTGRVACSPSIQVWPERGVANMRELGIAPEGHVFVSIDLDQIEFRIYVAVSGDRVGRKALDDGLDPHTLNYASMKAKNPKNETELMYVYHRVAEMEKRLDAPQGAIPDYWYQEWKKRRNIAKRFVFLIAFGGEADKLYETMKGDRDKATGELMFPGLLKRETDRWIENWHASHPETAEWQKYARDAARQAGYVATPMIDFRRRYFLGGIDKQNAPVNAIVQCCVPAHTRVLTDSGYQAIGGLSEEDGKFQAWTGTAWAPAKRITREVAERVAVKLDNGKTIDVDTNHMVLVANEDTASYEWKNVMQLVNGESIGTMLAEPNEYGKRTMSDEDAFWLGYYIGNGSCSGILRQTYLVIGNRRYWPRMELVKRFIAWRHSHGQKHTSIVHMRQKARSTETEAGYTNVTGGRALSDLFRNLGAPLGVKSINRRVPQTVWSNCLSVRKAFITGYIASDGYAGGYDKTADRECPTVLHTPNRALLEDIWLLCHTVGVDGTINGPHKNGSAEHWASNVVIFRALLYKHLGIGTNRKATGSHLAPRFEATRALADPITFKRNSPNYNSAKVLLSRIRRGGSIGLYPLAMAGIRPRCNMARVVSVTRTGIFEQMYTLSVDHPEHAYVAESMISKNSSGSVTNRGMLRIVEKHRHREFSRWSGVNLQIHDNVAGILPVDKAEEMAKWYEKAMYYEYEGIKFTGKAKIGKRWSDV